MIKKIAAAIAASLLFFSAMPLSFIKAEGSPGEAISVAAESAILMDQTSGRVLFEKDSHKKMRIASITKVMTALIAIESGKMNQTVKISDNAFGTEGSSIYLKKGEKMKLSDLIYGLLLRSGNDAAVAIAEKVAGSVPGFVYLMNKKARELGMLDTYFSNPHGLDDHEDHYSTAYDMALLTNAAMKDPEFRKIFKTKYHVAPNEEEKWGRKWKNKNKLLFRYKYSTGGKTGFTKRAGRTLISTANKGKLNLTVVTLNDGRDWEDHENLFNWAFGHYQMATIVRKGKITGIKQRFYPGRLYAHHDLTLPLSDEEKETLSTAVTLYEPPEGKQWKTPPSPAGKIFVKADDETIAAIPIFYDKPPKERGSFWSTFTHLIHMIYGYSSP